MSTAQAITDAVTPLGSGMLETPELLLRQVLLEGLVELAGDEPRLDELFARVDDLRQGTQDDWVDDFKAGVRRMAQLHAPGGIMVGVGYPMDDARYPYVSILTDSAGESAGGATLGDILGQTFVVQSTPTAADFNSTVSRKITTIGTDYSTSLQVGCWALAAEESTLLLTVVRHLLLRHKDRMKAAGVRDITMSESGFQPSPDMYPRTGYVPIVRVSLEWTLRQTIHHRRVPTRARLRVVSITNV